MPGGVLIAVSDKLRADGQTGSPTLATRRDAIDGAMEKDNAFAIWTARSALRREAAAASLIGIFVAARQRAPTSQSRSAEQYPRRLVR